MISDKELLALMKSIDPQTVRIQEGVRKIADAAYQLGLNRRSEIDANLCKSHRVYTRIGTGEKYLAKYIFDGERHEGVVYAEAIQNSKGEFK